MNFEIFSKIKTISLIFFLSFISLIITFIMYQKLDINGNNLKNNSKDLEEKLVKLNKKTKLEIKNTNLSIEFLNKKNLYFINIDDQLKLIKFNKDLEKKLNEIYPDIKLNINKSMNKTKSNLYELPFELEFKYKNIYYFNQLINYINNNYFYQLNEFNFNTKNQKFNLKGYFYSKKNIKELIK